MLVGFFKDETGAGVLEYAFLISLIAVVVMWAISGLSITVSTMYNNIANTITSTTGS